MTDAAPELALDPAKPPRRWRVTLADNSCRSIEAPAFRVEHGALVLVLPAGLAAAYAPGQWSTVEPETTEGISP